MSDIDLEKHLDAWSWKKEDFLTMFSHSEKGDPTTAMHVLNEEQYWSVSCLNAKSRFYIENVNWPLQEVIGHPYQSGKCFTYDPPNDRPTGWGYGIR